MRVPRPSRAFSRTVTLAVAIVLSLVAPPSTHAFDPFEWESVDRVEVASILQNTRTGEYMTPVAAGRTFDTLTAARGAARQAIAEYERMMADARAELERWRRAHDEYMASGEYAPDLAEARAAWREAMASRHTPWPEAVPDHGRRSWRRNPTVRRYFDGFDANADGVINWGEIKTFQQTVFETFQYRLNGRVLDPAEFMRYGGGDCDDFATFSAAFLEYHGYDAYVMVVERTGDPSSAHAVAALYLGEDTYEAGYHSIEAGPLYSGGSHGGGNYVLLDYWKVGGTIDRYDTLSHVARVDGVVGEPW